MLKIVSTAQMREIDAKSINKRKVPEIILMENAGLMAMRFLEELLGGLDGKRVGVFCGGGNNGGDGLVLARHLHLNGVKTDVYLLAKKKSLKNSAKTNMQILVGMGINVEEILSDAALAKRETPMRHAHALVDAILGTGLNSPIKGVYKTAVEKINEWKNFCLAVDIPTGISSDKGAIYEPHIHADATITFGFPKTGMVFYPALASVGRLKTVNVSFPPPVLEESPCDAYMLDREWVLGKMPARPPDAHKGNFGHAVVTGGSTGMGGALGLAAFAVLKTGAGLVTVAVPKSLSLQFELGVKEVMSYHLGSDLGKPENAIAISEFCRDKSALLIGPGMKRGANLTELVAKLVESVKIPIVIDADGLNNLAPKKEILKKAFAPVIVTPHPGEMSRLTGETTARINEDRLGAAKKFSAQYRCITVLKGARTVIASPDGVAYVNPTGNQNLATGGTGDVLSGMIAGFLAQGLAPLDASAVSVFIHGLTADLYTEAENFCSMTASDLLKYLPRAIGLLSNIGC